MTTFLKFNYMYVKILHLSRNVILKYFMRKTFYFAVSSRSLFSCNFAYLIIFIIEIHLLPSF